MNITQVTPFREAQALLEHNTIVKHRAGSHAYGTSLPTSDIDFRGIFCADPVNLLTPWYKVEEITIPPNIEEDTKFYELSNFMKLLTDMNPNIIESLWVSEQDIIFQSAAYEYLRSQRQELLSSKVAFTFSGYAISQLKRIKGHHKWINNPQDIKPPKQTNFVSLVQWFGEDKMFKIDIEHFRFDYRLLPYGGNIFGLIKSSGYSTYSDNFTLNTTYEESERSSQLPLAIVKFNKEEYNQALEKHKQYWGWKKNRNQVRSELEEKFLFDTKHAMHLVRLLRMCEEILVDGVVNVKRPDAQELLSIRNGAWSYEELIDYSEQKDHHIREVLYKKTQLPKTISVKKAAMILMNTQSIVWEGCNYVKETSVGGTSSGT